MTENTKTERLLKTARGQIDGILKMISENRDCGEISSQLTATQSILKKVNLSLMEKHITNCVKATLECDNEKSQEGKINEVVNLLNTILR